MQGNQAFVIQLQSTGTVCANRNTLASSIRNPKYDAYRQETNGTDDKEV
jgi:hypothetical protein